MSTCVEKAVGEDGRRLRHRQRRLVEIKHGLGFIVRTNNPAIAHGVF